MRSKKGRSCAQMMRRTIQFSLFVVVIILQGVGLYYLGLKNGKQARAEEWKTNHSSTTSPVGDRAVLRTTIKAPVQSTSEPMLHKDDVSVSVSKLSVAEDIVNGERARGSDDYDGAQIGARNVYNTEDHGFVDSYGPKEGEDIQVIVQISQGRAGSTITGNTMLRSHPYCGIYLDELMAGVFRMDPTSKHAAQ